MLKVKTILTKMKKFIPILTIAVSLFLIRCSAPSSKVTVTNPADFDRLIETVEIQLADVNIVSGKAIVIDQATGKEVLSQLVDKNSDGIAETVLFQVELKAKESKTFEVKEGVSSLEPTEVKTFARFVPERTDDYTWENDRVAFRTYGPEAQRMVEENIPGGTLSSGIDCWLKKVDYSIINKWYEGYQKDPMYYHSDHGEGLDNYHVGPSRGCGGTGVFKDGKYYASKNFVSYKTFFNGPISTEFELDYLPYDADGTSVKERKVISIDLGSNMTKFVIYVEGTDTLTTGVTMHDRKGTLSSDDVAGWVNWYAPHFGEEISTSVIADPKYYAGTSKIESEEADASHGLVNLKVIDGKVEFYSGFYWTGSKQFESNVKWEEYLNTFSKCLKTPLRVDVK